MELDLKFDYIDLIMTSGPYLIGLYKVFVTVWQGTMSEGNGTLLFYTTSSLQYTSLVKIHPSTCVPQASQWCHIRR